MGAAAASAASVTHVPNRLASATSPYLLQHADNPVDWWEWGPDAFEEARRRGVPVLLSVGYSACHWCHVMAHESFEDEATAALPQRPLRQRQGRPRGAPGRRRRLHAGDHRDDRAGRLADDRRPDPDGDPFFAGTYFPDRARGGMPAFRQVLEARHRGLDRPARRGRRVAEDLRAHLQRSVVGGSPAGGPEPVDVAVLAAAVARLRRTSTRCTAGSEGPRSSRPPWCSRRCCGTPTAPATDARAMVDATCEAMARGGLYDQLGGGFARYSVDRQWVVPHFEKMLYDNALLLGVYARWGGPLGERVARGDRRLPGRASSAPPRAGSPPRWTRTPRARRAASTSGRRRSCARRSASRTARGRPRCSR